MCWKLHILTENEPEIDTMIKVSFFLPAKVRKAATARSAEGDSWERNSGWMDEGTNQEPPCETFSPMEVLHRPTAAIMPTTKWNYVRQHRYYSGNYILISAWIQLKLDSECERKIVYSAEL